MTQAVQLMTTTETEAEALHIANALVERRLAACVQVVGPIVSVYRWQGAVERASEYQCLVKTRAELTSQVTGAIIELHSYDTPEVIATPITGGSAAYLRWVTEETAPPDTRREA
jgi:periplasmic divalent cation tolerance protein